MEQILFFHDTRPRIREAAPPGAAILSSYSAPAQDRTQYSLPLGTRGIIMSRNICQPVKFWNRICGTEKTLTFDR
jgi:hypothetical protein